MMKKIIAVMLSLALLLGCAAALADETGKVSIGTININGAFVLKCGLPQGYSVVPVLSDPDQVIVRLVSEDETKPMLTLSVAFDETYSDVDRFNDLDDEARAVLEETFTAVDPTIELSYAETAYGTLLLIAKQMNDTYNYIDFLSIYKGYFVEFVMTASFTDEDKSLSDEDLQMCIDFLSDMDFVPTGDNLSLTLAGSTHMALIGEYSEADNTLQVTIREPFDMSADDVDNLAVGNTMPLGDDLAVIETIEANDDDSSLLINGEIEVFPVEDGKYHLRFYDMILMKDTAVLNVPVIDTLVYKDDIDPESLEMLDEPAIYDAQGFLTALADEANGAGPGFDVDNVYVTFDAEGQLVEIERYYTPWQ